MIEHERMAFDDRRKIVAQDRKSSGGDDQNPAVPDRLVPLRRGNSSDDRSHDNRRNHRQPAGFQEFQLERCLVVNEKRDRVEDQVCIWRFKLKAYNYRRCLSNLGITPLARDRDYTFRLSEYE
jgi:hypothetical protein